MKIPYFCCIGAELKRYMKDFDFMNQVYLYKVPTDDTIDEVLSQDYFKAISDSVLQDDIIYIYEASAEILHECRFDKKDGHITAIPLASDETITGAATSIIHDNLTPNKILISDQNGKVAAGDVSLEYIKDTLSVLHCSATLSNTIDTMTVVMLDELAAFENLDSRPSYKAAGAIVVDNYGNAGIIESIDTGNQTANIITTFVAVVRDFTGATESEAGEAGLVPAPSAGDQDKILFGDGSWKKITLPANKAVISDAQGNLSTGNTTAAELAFLHGVTSAVQTQINNKQDTLVSGTNIKTVNGESLLGSGDVKIDAGGANLPILTNIWADHQLNDVSWLRADTFSWQSGDVYVAAYQHLAGDIDGKTLQSETIGGSTIQFYLADDGHKVCPASEESNVSAIYNSTGVAWYYILDTANQQFKLPRTKWGFTGLRDTVGGYVEAGLPNITGEINRAVITDGFSASGAFSLSGSSGQIPGYNSGAPQRRVVTFDASSSSSIYGASNTVQPKATEMYLYFYVGNFTQTALENTAGLNAEMFNNKVDLDFANVSATGKETVVGWGMPDYSAVVSMTSGSSAPKNGWAIAYGNNANVLYSVNGVGVAQGNSSVPHWSGNWNLQIMVSAGDVVTGGSWNFIPCKGVN